MLPVPTESDWPGDGLELDAKCAHKHFFGKTLAEAVQLFEEHAIYFQEDLMYMPAHVFRYYLKAYMIYLTSEAARDDADGASCFITLINFMTEHHSADVKPIWTEIEPVLNHLVEHQHDFYGADWFPYRDFRTRIRQLSERGFSTTIDLSQPEIVPQDVQLELLCALGSESYPWPVAVQIFTNLGVTELDADSKKPDVLKFFGAPISSGGGTDPRFGHHIPDWMHFRFRGYLVRFGFEADVITTVHFMHSGNFLQRSGIKLPEELRRWL